MNDSCTLVAHMGSPFGEVTRLLQRLAGGDQSARDELAPKVYDELHKLASFYLRRERSPHSWQTTELVNEAYLKMVGTPDHDFQGRSHFFGIAAQIMRRILTDHARRRNAEKRGGGVLAVPFIDGLAVSDEQVSLLADLDDALNRLESIDPQAAQVVELRFFGGLTEQEIAGLMGVSSRTVRRLWVAARAWLYGELTTKSE